MLIRIFIILGFSFIIGSNNLEISKEYSKIMWQGLKSTGSSHHGLISLKESTINIDDGKIIGGHIIIDMSSITCLDIKDTNSNKGLIGHLKSDDFFSVSDFSEASLHLVEINKLDDNNLHSYNISAELTILDQTHPIYFDASIQLVENGARAEGKIEIDRALYGIKYKSKSWYTDLGDNFINDIFYLYFSLVAIPPGK